MSGYIVGAMTRALVVPLVGQVELFGVRFQPGAGMPLFGVPAQELTDSAWPLEAVWRDEAHLAERLRESDDRPGFLGRILERHLGSRARHPDPRVVLAIGIMEQRRGDVRIDGIAEACGIGRRQLERLCRRDIGTSPKVAARVCRLQHAVSFLRSKPTAGLARVAAVAGYADQAHLNREFTSVVGVTPGVFRRQGL